MYSLLAKLILRHYYRVNAGFFLFFLFVFFGAVQGGSLVSYHLSLMNSILTSSFTLLLVLTCWTFYHFKCLGFVLAIFNRADAKFLANLQSLPPLFQWRLSVVFYVALYAPVLLYSVLLCVIGYRQGFSTAPHLVVLFQLLSIAGFSSVIYLRLHNWPKTFQLPTPSFQFRKYYLLYLVFYFTLERRKFFLLLKMFSFLLLSVALVWNKGKYSHDSFLLFYLILLMAHAPLSYLAVQFSEKELAFMRSMPVLLVKRITVFILTYVIVLLPELVFLLYHASAFPVEYRVTYYLNTVASLYFLTAVQYSSSFSSQEYLKASLALFFFSIFALHAQAFWVWIGIQFTIATILFGNGFYRYQADGK